MNILRTITTPTPDGDFTIIVNNHNVAQASGFGNLTQLITRLPSESQPFPVEAADNHPYEALVRAYYEGDIAALDSIPRTQPGSDFQKKVWQAISSIPYGQTVSYKELALISGNPAAIRAAGTICGLNRLILLIPCHRILKSDGGIGNYLYGSVIKKSLLEREARLLHKQTT